MVTDIEDIGAEIEELAALNAQLAKANEDAEIECTALASALRELVAAVTASLDPKWAELKGGRARLEAAVAKAREVLRDHPESSADGSTPTAAHEAGQSIPSVTPPGADRLTGRPPRGGAAS